jgi:glucose-6-phosphate isomerase
VVGDNGRVRWERNGNYAPSELVVSSPGDYSAFGIYRDKPLYTQFESDFDAFQWVSKPDLVANLWKRFIP